MYMSDKLYSSKLNPSEKLVLAYILTGHYRYKYISLETFAKKLYMSQPSISKTLKALEQKELIKWVKVEANKYKIIIVCQRAFSLYGYIDKNETINEKKITRDPIINTLGEIEAQKDLLKFDKKAYSLKTDKRESPTPKWYSDYKEEKTQKAREMTEEEEKELKNIVNELFL